VKKIRLALGKRSYDILIGKDLISRLPAICLRLGIGRDPFIITNGPLFRRYGREIRASFLSRGITARFEIVPDSEKAKSLAIASQVLASLASYDVKRTVFIVAFGGGVVGDLSGLIAALYKRGIPYVQVPSTLLAQVDSSIGGKTAVDLPAAKNLIGAFYQPRVVVCDTSLIRTLPRRQVANAMAEVIKYGVIGDERLFGYLERHHRALLAADEKALAYVIGRCAAAKARLVSQDEHDEKGIRMALNYGHTIGHAIEAAAGYTAQYYHGEAVALGMLVGARISLSMKLLRKDVYERIENLISRAGLPTSIRRIHFSAIYKAHLHDKKFSRGVNRFVLPVRIGKVKIVSNVPHALIRDAVTACMGG